MPTRISSLSPQPQRIILSPDNPFSFLNYAYPLGVPVATSQISFSGLDCYEFLPDSPPPIHLQAAIAQVISGDEYPELCFYKFWQHHRVFIPAHWAIERGVAA